MEVPLPWANIQEEMEEVERVICGSSDDFTNILSLLFFKNILKHPPSLRGGPAYRPEDYAKSVGHFRKKTTQY